MEELRRANDTTWSLNRDVVSLTTRSDVMTTSTVSKSFTAWLIEQRKRDDPTGDLARDVRRDLMWPRNARSLAAFRVYLRNNNADESAVAALEAAWAEYQERR
jgi:uncharacterized protein YozE (UPF0346 family)